MIDKRTIEDGKSTSAGIEVLMNIRMLNKSVAN